MNAKEQRTAKDKSMSQLTNNRDINMTTPKHVMNYVRIKVRTWRDVSRQRNELRNLSDQLLKDIGISQADAQREADRHFWDLAPYKDKTIRQSQNSRLIQCCSDLTLCCKT